MLILMNGVDYYYKSEIFASYISEESKVFELLVPYSVIFLALVALITYM